MRDDLAVGHAYRGPAPRWSHAYLRPAIEALLDRQSFRDKRAFDLGCGNGATTRILADRGFRVVGVDPSSSGISVARENFPGIEFHQGSTDDDLAARYGSFPLVMSLEVVEHCFDPREFARRLYSLVEPGGIAIVSTPYHGYLKNLALAVAGRWDAHLAPLWDGGHIKFFSIPTLRTLLQEAGFSDVDIIRVGRIPPFAKSMIAIARR